MPENKNFDGWLDKWFLPLLVTGILLNFSAIFITIIEPDGALYASVAKQMALRNDFINLFAEGKDWLDKPHFPFWMTALSFKIFGINTFAYKFPALLFWLLGAIYTFKFSKEVYGTGVAKLSLLVYLTALHLIISNNDVRAEPYLTGLIIAAVYFFYKAQSEKWFWPLLAGSLFAACAVMTKGIFVLIFIGAGFVIHWIIKKDWRQLFHVKWIVAILLTGIFIFPELYTLYLQFDRHPEKIIFGKQGISGLRFFFWDSQFGRFNNSGPIKGSGDPFFFIHTLLWAFLPWSLMLFAALFSAIKNSWRKKFQPEYICMGVSVTALLLFSISKFQLPHYTNIIFPFLAIITAHFVYTLKKGNRTFTVIQYVQTVLIFLLTISLIILFKPSNLFFSLCWVALIAGIAVYLFKKMSLQNAIGISVLTAVLLNGYINLFFYPQILQYQSGTAAANWLKNYTGHEPVAVYQLRGYSLDFYAKQPVSYYNMDSVLKETAIQPVILYAAPESIADFKQEGLTVRQLAAFEHFPVTKLSLSFINSRTRKETVKNAVLIQVSLP